MRTYLVIVGLAACTAGIARAEIGIAEPPKNSGTTTSVVVPPPKSSTTATPVAAAGDADVLKFLNGDALHGVVLGTTAPSGLKWRRADVKEPITFDLANVGEIALAPRAKVSAGTQSIVELTNGDALPGELVGVDEKAVTLKTWYAGTVTLKRSMVQRVVLASEVAETAYTGPNSLDEWKGDGNRNAWTFKKGALIGIGSGTIGRDVRMPDVANIEFDLAWRGQLYLQFGFGFDDFRQLYNSGGYMVQMSYSSIYLQRYRPRSGNNNMGSNVEMQELQRKSKLHVALRVNKAKKTIALFLDGNLVKQWTEGDDWTAKGQGLVFMSQGQGQTRVSNITVSSWDGRLETETGGGAKDADLVRLNNGDKVSGMVKTVKDGQISLAASFADMNVPLERATAIELATAKSERSRRNANDVQVFFLDGRRLTLALDKLDEANFAGTSENFGKLTSTLSAFRRVLFHIYEKREENSDDDEWGGAGAAAVPVDE